MPEYASPYCLHCYAPLARSKGASYECSACGLSSLQVDFGRLWTREPGLRKLERLAKALILTTMVCLTALILLNPGVGISKGHGMVIGAPLLIGVLLWDLASITRSESQFRGDIVWPIVGWGLGPIVGYVLFGLWTQSGNPLLLGLFVLCCAVTLPAVFSPLIRRWWRSWRVRHVLRAQGVLGRPLEVG